MCKVIFIAGLGMYETNAKHLNTVVAYVCWYNHYTRAVYENLIGLNCNNIQENSALTTNNLSQFWCHIVYSKLFIYLSYKICYSFAVIFRETKKSKNVNFSIGFPTKLFRQSFYSFHPKRIFYFTVLFFFQQFSRFSSISFFEFKTASP